MINLIYYIYNIIESNKEAGNSFEYFKARFGTCQNNVVRSTLGPNPSGST